MRFLTMLLATILVVAGCHAVANLDRSDNSRSELDDKSVRELVREGMSIEEAVRNLEKHGFQRISASKASDNTTRNYAEMYRDWIVLEKKLSPNHFYTTMEIRIKPIDAKVKEVSVESLPIPCL